MSYVLRMRQGSDGYKGLTEYMFTTSTPPHGGNCDVMPTEGKAYETTFTFRCSNWKANNLPLLYVFAYQDPYTLLRTTLFRTEEDEFSIKLPPGDPAEKFLLTVYFSVIDPLGAEIDNHKLITVFSTFLLVIVVFLRNMIEKSVVILFSVRTTVPTLDRIIGHRASRRLYLFNYFC